MKLNEFWEKFINYIYIKYLINKNNKVSLFSFVQLIEQYFILCENNSADDAKEFKKLITDIIYKIYNNEEINKFMQMNKLNNMDQLFAKYEIVMKYGNLNIN